MKRRYTDIGIVNTLVSLMESDSERKKRWMGAIGRALEPHGFSVSGRTLWRRQAGNWAIVSFDWISREEPITGFYCFVGLTSDVIAGFDGMLRHSSSARLPGKRPGHAYKCEIFAMLQMFAPDGHLNTRWHIDSRNPPFFVYLSSPEGSVEDILTDVMRRFDAHVLPLLAKLQTDEQLRDYLVAGGTFGNVPGTYERAILTRILGPREEFDRAVLELRQAGLGEPGRIAWRRQEVGIDRLIAGDLDARVADVDRRPIF